MEAAENHASHNLAVLGKGMFVVILQRWEYRGTSSSRLLDCGCCTHPREHQRRTPIGPPLPRRSSHGHRSGNGRNDPRNRFAKLLQGPGCRWMRGDVAMQDAPCPDLHQEEHIESSKPSGHHDQEIAGDDGLGVIADKRLPVLRRGSPVASSLRFGRPIGAHRPWRNIDTQLDRQLR
jgi:hypothetical protein